MQKQWKRKLGLSQAVTLLLGMYVLLGPTFVLAQEGAVDTLGQAAAVSDSKPVGGAGSWAAYVTQPKAVKGEAETSTASQSAPLSPLYLGFGALFLVGLAGAGGYFMAKARLGEEVAKQISTIQLPVPASLPPRVEPKTVPIQLLGSDVIEGYGSLLILDLDGEYMSLFVAEQTGSATMLCRLSEPPSLGWRLDEIASSVVEALRFDNPQEAAVAMNQAVPRQASSEGSGSPPGQDEDLDVLLDELLGKVGGLRPTVKG